MIVQVGYNLMFMIRLISCVPILKALVFSSKINYERMEYNN